MNYWNNFTVRTTARAGVEVRIDLQNKAESGAREVLPAVEPATGLLALTSLFSIRSTGRGFQQEKRQRRKP